jgi:hypothetical protein
VSFNASTAPSFLSDFFLAQHRGKPTHRERRVQCCSNREASRTIIFHSLPITKTFSGRVRAVQLFHSHASQIWSWSWVTTHNQSASLSWCRAPDGFLFSIWQLWVYCCDAPSLATGLVCNWLAQLLLGQRSHFRVQVSQNARPYFIVSLATLPTWTPRSPYLHPPGTGCLG